MTVRILGPFPPPFGGVALHCIRLLEALRGKGLHVRGVSLGGVPKGISDVTTWMPWMLLSRRLVHYHTDEGNHRWMRLLSLAWRLTRTPYVVTVHSFRDRPEFRNARTNRSLATSFRHAKAVIAISTEVADSLESTLGFRHASTHVIPSNLPLSAWELSAELPASVAEKWRSASVRILANAGRVVTYNGKDLYGIDVLLQAFRSIEDSDVELCIAVGDVVDEALWHSNVALVEQDPRVTIVRHLTSPLTPFVKHAHVVVRPTRTEGGPSLTLGEALELGRWAIGSDAVPRPHGTVTFRNEAAADLARALQDCISNVRSGHMPPAITDNVDAVEKIVEVYWKASY